MIQRKIKLVAFDLDGVLFDGNILHFYALNSALKNLCDYEISMEDHETVFDGLSTKQKIDYLCSKGLIIADEKKKLLINDLKQKFTVDLIPVYVKEDKRLRRVVSQIKKKGFMVCCVSNCIRDSVELILGCLKLRDLFDFTISNQDVVNPKPAPDPYLEAVRRAGVVPSQVLVFEDNEKGWKSVSSAGCHLFKVNNSSDVTFGNFIRCIRRLKG